MFLREICANISTLQFVISNQRIIYCIVYVHQTFSNHPGGLKTWFESNCLSISETGDSIKNGLRGMHFCKLLQARCVSRSILFDEISRAGTCKIVEISQVNKKHFFKIYLFRFDSCWYACIQMSLLNNVDSKIGS